MIQHRDVFNIVRDAIFIADTDTGMIVDANRAAEALCGRSLQELRSMHHTQLHPSEYAESARRGFEKDTRVPGLTEGLILHKDGHRIPIEIASSHYTDTDGRQVLVGIFRDTTERKRTEAALRESEDLYRTLFDQSADCIFLMGLGAGVPMILGVNEAALKSHGYSRQEMIGKPISLIEPEISQESLDARMHLIAEGKPFYMVHRRKDGSTFEVESAARLVRIGGREMVLAVGRDITKRKEAEQALVRQNEFIQAALDNISDGVVACDADGNLALFNRAAREWHGIDALKLPPDQWSSHYDLFGPDGTTPLATEAIPLRRAFNGEQLKDVGMTIAANGQPLRHILASGRPFYDYQGRKLGAIAAMHDITERKQAERALRESEARLKSAERMTQVGNWVFNIRENRALWSEGLCRILGLPLDHEPSYEGVLQMMLPEGRDRVEQWVSACLSEKKGGFIEARIVRPDGDVRMVAWMSEVLLDGDGSPTQIFGSCQDVTDAKRAQEEAFARQKLESLGTLAGGIAHDFNNLLGGVLAQTELAMAELATGSHPDEELKAIRDVAIRGSEIVRQLMIYAGRESEVLGPVDVSKVVEGMLGLFKVTVSRHATLVTNLDEDLPAVQARTAQLSQIVMNLVVNASEAIGNRDGAIRVSTEHIAVGQAEAIANGIPPGDFVQLEVSDTGCGMSAETKAKVLEPFFTTKFSGRGLGLAVVHGIVRSLRGAIQIASEPDKGSTFQILLPCTEAGARPVPGGGVPIEESATPTRRATVLIVEDEEALRVAEAKMLRKSGFETVEAASGSAAIDLLRTKGDEIDLILLDLTIPGAASQEIVDEAALSRPNVKIILTSAYSEEEVKPTMRTPVVGGFIRKPFKLADVVQTLQGVLVSQVKRR